MSQKSQNFLTELERVRETLVEQLEDLDALLEGAADLPQRVSVGQVLWSLNAALDRRLSALKEQLRKEVSHTRPGTVKIAGVHDDHHVALTVPAPKYVLRKGVKVEELQDALGEDFQRLFQLHTTCTPNEEALEAEFVTATPERKRLLLRVLDQRGGTVRVSFRE